MVDDEEIGRRRRRYEFRRPIARMRDTERERAAMSTIGRLVSDRKSIRSGSPLRSILTRAFSILTRAFRDNGIEHKLWAATSGSHDPDEGIPAARWWPIKTPGRCEAGYGKKERHGSRYGRSDHGHTSLIRGMFPHRTV